ncbi:SIT4 phosphatase-associated protein-domain-containing protein [Lipomyces japonicus]|uniref:SIT4 phosphatase-associated protein-domain-containing protein n=1 Tax=Lipomyces japonicus TaxID=56871 RepID=UPI0034CFC7BA
MAFWRVGANFASMNAASGVNKLLEKPDCSLAELLEEDDILQELREHNAKLIEFLRQPRILQQMLRYVSHWSPPDLQSDQQQQQQHNDGLSPTTTSTEGNDFIDNEAAHLLKDIDKENGIDGQNSVQSSDADAVTISSISNSDSEDDENHVAEVSSDYDDDSTIDEIQEENDVESDGEEDLGLTRVAASPESGSSDIFDDEKAWRYARLSAEVFASEIWSIYEAVMHEPALLTEFWQFLDNPNPIDQVYAGYFTKTNEQFLERKTEQMIEFLKTIPDLVPKFMRHIDTPSIMDLLLKILCTDKPDSPTGIIDTLQSQRLIPSLISFLSDKTPSNTQSASGDFLKALITISANASSDYTSIGPNELTRELVSPEAVTQLAHQMVTSGGTALATAVGVIIELIRKNNSDYDMDPLLNITLESHPPGPRDPIYLGYMLKILAQSMPRFERILAKKRDDRLATSFGEIEPLGFERFKICELVAELLHCSNMGLLNDPRGEQVALQRDAIRRQNKKLWSNTDTRSAYSDSDSGIHDLGASLNVLSVSDQQQQLQQSPPVTESRRWWGLGKKKATPGNSPTKEYADPIADDEANKEQPIDTEPEPIEAVVEEDAQSSDDLAELVESESQLSPNGSNLSDNNEDDDQELIVANLSEEYLADENELVVGDFLKLQLIKYGIVSTIVKLFFRFPWNNFLHNVVFDIIQQIFNGPIDHGYNRYLAIELFKTDNITNQIVEGTKDSNEHEATTRMRLGYMGHLTLISEEIVKFLQKYPPESLSSAVIENTIGNQAWNYYVNETLIQIRIRDNSILGGQRPNSGIQQVHQHQLITMGGMEDYNTRDDDDEDEEEEDEEDDDDDAVGELSAGYLDDVDNNNSRKNNSNTNDDNDVDKDDVDDLGDGIDAAGKGPGDTIDHWSQYMSQQMTPDRIGSSDEDDEDDEVEPSHHATADDNDDGDDSDELAELSRA